MFRDRVVSMEQTLEGGEKNLEFLKAICREALPEFEYREHFLEHERDLFVMLLEAADGRKKRVGWTRMVLFDAERLPALVENPVSPLRSRILAYLQARVARPEIVVTFRHLEDGWVDTPEPRREKRRGRRGGRDGRRREAGAGAPGQGQKEGQGQAQGPRGPGQRDRDRKQGRGGPGGSGGPGGPGRPQGGRDGERQRQRQRGGAPQQGQVQRDVRDANPAGSAAVAGLNPGVPREAVGEMAGADAARPGGGAGRRRRFRRRRRGRGGAGGTGGGAPGQGGPGGSGAAPPGDA